MGSCVFNVHDSLVCNDVIFAAHTNTLKYKQGFRLRTAYSVDARHNSRLSVKQEICNVLTSVLMISHKYKTIHYYTVHH